MPDASENDTAIHSVGPEPNVGQLLVHGIGFSPDHHTIAVVAIGSNAVNFIDTPTNIVKHITYAASRSSLRTGRALVATLRPRRS
jgi:hypothetical protein